MKQCILTLVLALAYSSLSAQLTYKGDTTPNYEQLIAFYQDLSYRYSGAELVTIGEDDNGYPIHLFVLSDGSSPNPEAIRSDGRNILFILNGIHAGETDGIDASMMLAKTLLDNDRMMGLLAKTAVCIVPVYNVSGFLQRGCCSRVNQNGPEEHGFRGNARYLDLNRDMMKMDSKNAAALVSALVSWDPDVFMDTHTTNGADHQFVMELLPTQDDRIDPSLGKFMNGSLLPGLQSWMDQKKMLMGPYFELRGRTPEDGLMGFNDSPRYTTGYTTTRNIIGVLSETHMLKSHADRVNAAYQLMLATLSTMDSNSSELKEARAAAKERTRSMTEYPIKWELDTTAVEDLLWKGYAAKFKISEVTGQERLYYEKNEPTEVMVPWYDKYVPTRSVKKPKAYIVPQAWNEVILRLKANGVVMRPLQNDTTMPVQAYRISDFKTVERPYEGHYLHHSVEVITETMERTVRKGDMYIPTGTNNDRYLLEALEPEADDSFFAWGFFDAVLQQKEWFSPYLFDDVAAELLTTDADLSNAFHAKRADDEEFAANWFEQLLFIYQRSPYFEPGYRLYPVFRVAH